MSTRLNKFLARSGVASRREADRLISQGRVRINGRVVDRLGVQVEDEHDRVEVDGRPVRPEHRPVYIILNKPAGYLVTLSDPLGRPTIRKLLPGLPRGVVPVGRLDFESEGLLVLTNDGDLAFRLTHPRYEVVKTYAVRVDGEVGADTVARLQRGISLDGKKAAPDRIVLLEAGTQKSQLRLELHEGRKREVRRMFEAVGHRVSRLRRVAFAGLTVKNLPLGEWRALTSKEVASLKKMAGLSGTSDKAAKKKPARA
jgi:pseudouridine synthase